MEFSVEFLVDSFPVFLESVLFVMSDKLYSAKELDPAIR